MDFDWLCRVGVHGQVLRLKVAAGSAGVQRGMQLVCRTIRGIELAESLAPSPRAALESDGKILRPFGDQDQLLWKHLQRYAAESLESCSRWLVEQSSSDVLLEVEPLLDGKTLYFHFLGEPSPQTSQQIERLVELYQQRVAASRFARLVEEGCGPGCGTSEKSKCGTSEGCASCQIACAKH